jgi:hypothetical protein
MEKTQSTKEAMAVLKYRRQTLIRAGRLAAVKIAAKRGRVTSRDVHSSMGAQGLLDPTISDYWLGAVFNRAPELEWTGEYESYSNESRNIHERTVKVWRLSEVGKVVAAAGI